MPNLFDPLKMRSVTLRSRIGASPMFRYSTVSGVPQTSRANHLGGRATGSAASWQQLAAPLLAALLCTACPAARSMELMPQPSGKAEASLSSFDDAMQGFMVKCGIPGASLTVLREGRLVYARGYGWANVETRKPVEPDSLFRIASLTKPITAAAILTLVEDPELRLDLNASAFGILGQPGAAWNGTAPDRRLAGITIRHLLHHTGGFDRDMSGDPMFQSSLIAKSLGVACPPGPEDIIAYMYGRPLDFDPGARYCYSNFGYCVLGRIVETLSGKDYAQYVQEKVLAPLGIRDMHLARTLESETADGEVHYYQPDDGLKRPVVKGGPILAPAPYGGYCIEAMDSHGGWLASSIDLARIAAALDSPQGPGFISPETTKLLDERPAAENGFPALGPHDPYYGLGWMVRPVGDEGSCNRWHTGKMAGAYCLVVRRWDGVSWVALFNQRPSDKQLQEPSIETLLHDAADAVRDWPQIDLLTEYFPTTPPSLE